MTPDAIAEITVLSESEGVSNSSAIHLTLISCHILYAILRAVWVPSDGAVAGGFSHDSAYLSIVAEQVRLGHGLVNPAHWLLVLHPSAIPMPYHNANPVIRCSWRRWRECPSGRCPLRAPDPPYQTPCLPLKLDQFAVANFRMRFLRRLP